MKKYTATESALRILARREYCKMNGHALERMDYTLASGNEERMYRCENCDVKFDIQYPPLDYTVSEE
jgi:hypothetical protein